MVRARTLELVEVGETSAKRVSALDEQLRHFLVRQLERAASAS